MENKKGQKRKKELDRRIQNVKDEIEIAVGVGRSFFSDSLECVLSRLEQPKFEKRGIQSFGFDDFLVLLNPDIEQSEKEISLSTENSETHIILGRSVLHRKGLNLKTEILLKTRTLFKMLVDIEFFFLKETGNDYRKTTYHNFGPEMSNDYCIDIKESVRQNAVVNESTDNEHRIGNLKLGEVSRCQLLQCNESNAASFYKTSQWQKGVIDIQLKEPVVLSNLSSDGSSQEMNVASFEFALDKKSRRGFQSINVDYYR